MAATCRRTTSTRQPEISFGWSRSGLVSTRRQSRSSQAFGVPARRLAGVGWLVQTPRPDVVVLAEDLVELTRFPLPSVWRASHWVSPDLAFVVVSERDRVMLSDRCGGIVWQSVHHPWGGGNSESGSCWVSADGRQVWARTPRGLTTSWHLTAERLPSAARKRPAMFPLEGSAPWRPLEKGRTLGEFRAPAS
jgi:hypothetical protein